MAWDPIRTLAGWQARFDAATAVARDPLIQEYGAQRQHLVNLLGHVQAVGTRLDSWRSTLTGIGGVKDPSAAPNLRYTPRPAIDPGTLEATYIQGGVAARIVDLPATDATKNGGYVLPVALSIAMQDDFKPEDHDQVVDSDGGDLNVWPKACEALQAGDLYGGAWLYPVLEEDPPRGLRAYEDPLSLPLDLNRIRRVLALEVITRPEMTPDTWEGDAASGRLREVSVWHWQPTGALGHGGRRIHHSRLIYVPGFRLPSRVRWANGGVDASVLEVVSTALARKDLSAGGAATLSQRVGHQVVKMNDLAHMDTNTKTTTLRERLDVIQQGLHRLGAVVVGQNEEFHVGSTPLAGFRDLYLIQRDEVAEAVGWPKRKLYGDQATGLGGDGESDDLAWRAIVAGVQSAKLRPMLRRLFTIIMSAKQGPTGGKVPDQWCVWFAPVDQPTAAAAADVELKKAQARKLLVDAGDVLPALDMGIDYGAMGDEDVDGLDDPTDPDAGADNPPAPAAPVAPEGGEQAPAAAPADGAAPTTDDVAKQAMNGAQIASMIKIVEAAQAGSIPKASAQAIATLAFPDADGSQLQAMFADVEEGSAPKPVPPGLVPPTPPAGDDDEGDEPDDEQAPDDDDDEDGQR